MISLNWRFYNFFKLNRKWINGLTILLLGGYNIFNLYTIGVTYQELKNETERHIYISSLYFLFATILALIYIAHSYAIWIIMAFNLIFTALVCLPIYTIFKCFRYCCCRNRVTQHDSQIQ